MREKMIFWSAKCTLRFGKSLAWNGLERDPQSEIPLPVLIWTLDGAFAKYAFCCHGMFRYFLFPPWQKIAVGLCSLISSNPRQAISSCSNHLLAFVCIETGHRSWNRSRSATFAAFQPGDLNATANLSWSSTAWIRISTFLSNLCRERDAFGKWGSSAFLTSLIW